MPIVREPRPWRRFAALGDSFTEGLMDDVDATGRHRGWADDVAIALAAQVDDAVPMRYANLAVRGRLVRQVVVEQVPAALALEPDLVSLAVGVNDTIRPRFDLDGIATAFERGVRTLRASGIDVVVFAFGDPSRRSPIMGPVRDRIRRFNSAVEAIADAYDCYLVDFWQCAVFDDDALWDDDRLHLTPTGHRLVARAVLASLGLGDDSWRTPAVPGPRASVLHRARENARWAGVHLGPWAMRRVRGRSSGDAVVAKHPDWIEVARS